MYIYFENNNLYAYIMYYGVTVATFFSEIIRTIFIRRAFPLQLYIVFAAILTFHQICLCM